MKQEPTTKFAILLLFFLFLIGSLQDLSAQIVLDTGLVETKTISCGGSTIFTDDNLTSGTLYFDEKARIDSVIICPNSSGRQVKASFTSFDIAANDRLTVVDGDVSKNGGAPRRSASGSGASSAFGGWYAANCDPAVNPTGCLTFIFETNGDNAKGTGWQATLTCESSSTTVQCPSNVSAIDACNNLDGMVSVTIPKPTFTTCGGTSNAMVNITTNCTAIPGGTVLADGGTLGTYTIPLGTYTITATSTADASKTCTYFVYADQPNITCNDNLTVPIGFGCSANVGVDDLIENPCVGSGTTYTLSVNLGKEGTKSVTVDGTNFNTLNSKRLVLSADDFDCGDEYAIEITRTVSFTGCGSGNSVSATCSARVRFIDNVAPTITASSPTLTTCGNLSDAEVKRKLTVNVIDNCGVKDTIISVGAFPTNFCRSDLSVPITVTAVDFCGNRSTETFLVKIVRPTNFFPPRDTALNCGSGFGPAIAGYPLLDTDGDGKGDLPIIDNTCSFIATFSDQEVTAGNSQSRKIFRTWRIQDWCNQSPPVDLPTQLIELKDTGKPSINCPSGSARGTENNPHTVFASGSDCTGSINFSAPTGGDDCGGTVTVTLDAVVELKDKTKYTNTTGLPVGNYFAVYFGRDASGNRSDSCKVYFTVIDQNGPQASCVDALNVSFVNGTTTIRVQDIDAGSNDNCGPVTREISKDGEIWRQTVSLTCEEVNRDGKIYLRITDSNGGQNTCWAQIIGKDVTVPECGQLTNQTLKCEEVHLGDFGPTTDINDNKDFDTNEWRALTGSLETIYNQNFGNPNCADDLTCGTSIIEQEYQLVNAPCGGTKIIRRYRATDGANNHSAWKEQLITLTTDQEFSVTFPQDWEGKCGDNFPAASLDLQAGGCNILAWTHEDKRFDGVSGACFYIERTYLVTNWCNHQVGQIPTDLSRAEDEHGFSNGLTVTNETLASAGLFRYVQVLKVTDDELPTITINSVDDCISEENCTATKTFSITAQDCAGAESLSYTYEAMVDGQVVESGQATQFSTNVAIGQLTVNWTVNDNCGNTATATETYNFRDCKAPSPVCLDGLAIPVDDNQKAVVWAEDFNQKSFDNCSPESKLEFRVYHPVLAENGISKPQSTADAATILDLPTNIELTCDYLGNQAVELYVVDEAGNWDFCTGSVFIQDGSGACGSGLLDTTNVAMVSGGLLARNNIPLAGVKVTAKGTTFFEQSTTTNDLGIFELNLPKNIGYTINFSKPDDPRQGVSTFDLILVSKHILGITNLEELWQQLAADMNKSGSITAFDLVVMRQVILGIESSLVAENPWRFLPVSGEFETGENGLKLEEGIIIPALTGSLTALDYFAVKMGDVNGSVQIDGWQQSEERNSKESLKIPIADQAVRVGDLVKVAIELADITNWQGLQFALNFSDLELVKVENGLGKATHLAVKEKGVINIAWDQYSAAKTEGTTLFTFQFKAQKSGQLSDFLTLSKDFQTEAVNTEDQVSKVLLDFKTQPVNPSFELFQNAPNPFSTTTTIDFNLTKSSPVKLEIFDLQGQLLTEYAGNYAAGTHQVVIHKSDLAKTGILVYQLTTAEGVVAKKMMVLE